MILTFVIPTLLIFVCLAWYLHVIKAADTKTINEQRMDEFLELSSTQTRLHSFQSTLISMYPNTCSRDQEKRDIAYAGIRKARFVYLRQMIESALNIPDFYVITYIKNKYPELENADV